MCPTVRRTPALEHHIAAEWDRQASALVRRYDPQVLARAVSYLYTKETRSSFAIEGETPSASRTQRLINALRSAADFDPTSKEALLRLQASIVDPRYAATDWRTVQNFVGEIIGGYRERVHFIGPRPQDVPDLMAAWMAMTERLLPNDIDDVVAAACAAFAFVFVHQFEMEISRRESISSYPIKGADGRPSSHR